MDLVKIRGDRRCDSPLSYSGRNMRSKCLFYAVIKIIGGKLTSDSLGVHFKENSEEI